MDFEIKEVEDELFENCAEVIRRSFMTVAKEFGLTKENSPTNGAFIEKERLLEEKARGQFMYGLFQGEQLVGYMQLEKNREELYYLQKVAVLPEFRHQGYGRKLLDFAKEQVLKKGGSKISIGIVEENTVLKNWYLDYGFIATGTKKFEHLPFTVGFMELPLNKQECLICRKHEENRGVIFRNDLIFISHKITHPEKDDNYLGYYYIETKRHFKGVYDATDEEMKIIGIMVKKLAKALMTLPDMAHVYSFIMGEGVDHLHVHVVGRYKNAPREYWGSKVDEWPEAPRGNAETVKELNYKIQSELSKLL